MFSPSYSNFSASHRGLIPRRVNLPGGMIPLEVIFSYLKIEEISEISVAQAVTNDEKTGGRKSRWTVPFRGTSPAELIELKIIPLGKKLVSLCFSIYIF